MTARVLPVLAALALSVVGCDTKPSAPPPDPVAQALASSSAAPKPPPVSFTRRPAVTVAEGAATPLL